MNSSAKSILFVGLILTACGGSEDTEDKGSPDSGSVPDAAVSDDAGDVDPSARPSLTNISPANAATLHTESVTISFEVASAAANGYSLTLGGATVAESEEGLALGAVVQNQIDLAIGVNKIGISVLDAQGVADSVEYIYLLAADRVPNPPELSLDPAALSSPEAPTVHITGSVKSSDPITAAWQVGDREGALEVSGSAPEFKLQGDVPLRVGENSVVITATNSGGSDQAQLSLSRSGDTLAPELELIVPRPGATTPTRSLTVRGTVSEDDVLGAVWITLGTARVEASVRDGVFSAQLPLSTLGERSFTVHARDASGNEATVERSVYLGSRIAAGYLHGGVVSEEGALFTWGANNSGQAGIGVATEFGEAQHPASPTRVMSGVAVNSVFAARNSSLVLAADGHVWAFGSNSYGQLCLPASAGAAVLSPTQLDIEGVVAIALGEDFSLFLMADGHVYACGSNASGVVPDGAATGRAVLVPGLSGVVHIVASGGTAYAVDGEGALFAWGANTYGQLGQGDEDDNAHPSPVQLSLPAVDTLEASGRHVLALSRAGEVYGWGLNQSDQVGSFDARQLDAPALLSWSQEAEVVWVGAEGNTSFMGTAAGDLYGWGQSGANNGVDSQRDQPLPTTPLSGAEQVIGLSVGMTTSFALSGSSRSFYGWGGNYSGSLGAGDRLTEGASYTAAVEVAIPPVD